jgi:hypothetical protein
MLRKQSRPETRYYDLELEDEAAGAPLQSPEDQ